jgi:hypothetical protein
MVELRLEIVVQHLGRAGDSGRVLTSMLTVLRVLSKHILYTSLSTSLTLKLAPLAPKGDEDALEREYSDARKAELHNGVAG